jgi:hypothetical protein
MLNACEECTNHNLINYKHIVVAGKYYTMNYGMLENCRVLGAHSNSYKEFSLMRYNTVQSVESQLTFWGNMLSVSSGSKGKPSK